MSGHACRDRKSLVMSAVFAFADPNLFAPFFRSTGGRLLNVYKLALGMTSDKGFDAFSILSRTKVENISLPTFGAAFRLLTIRVSMTSPVSNVISAGPVSLKGLTTVPSLTRLRRAFRSRRNFFCPATEDYGCSKLTSLFDVERLTFSNSSMTLSTAGLESSITSFSSC